MSYRQFKPDAALSTYIDAFWEVTSDDTKTFPERIMPDCCIDIIINLGTDVIADSSGLMMKNERAYLVGTMTRYKDIIREPGTRLIGIRFKPAGFVHLYKYGPLREFTDKIAEFEKRYIPSFNTIENASHTRFDTVFHSIGILKPAKFKKPVNLSAFIY